MSDIKQLLDAAALHLQAYSNSATLDSELLLCKSIQKSRSYLRAWPDKEILQADQAVFNRLISQRQQGMPIAYLLGEKEFWSRPFKVTPAVLIPRPDTERLIELCLQRIPTDKPYHILELGTGSGIIAITLAAERPLAKLIATDISEDALLIAVSNAHTHRIKSIQFIQSNWFEKIASGSYDLIVSNPPYIAEDDPHLHQGDLRFEPATALISPVNGLADIMTIVDKARYNLVSGGWLMIEHGYNQGESVQGIFRDNHYEMIQTHTDLAGLPRVTIGQMIS